MWAARVPEQPSPQPADVLVLAKIGFFTLRGDGFIDGTLGSFEHMLVSHDTKHQSMFRRIARPHALDPVSHGAGETSPGLRYARINVPERRPCVKPLYRVWSRDSLEGPVLNFELARLARICFLVLITSPVTQ